MLLERLPFAGPVGTADSENRVPTVALQYEQTATPTVSGIPHSGQVFLIEDISGFSWGFFVFWGLIECFEAFLA